ncbi:verrucotoxin subunit beta-like [Pseudochaenichthys georgianus]|uniref:verrucotoxin subunit beta-like n=1 Tax=Pseudochaenichthys georgianus TaxID=52239 RepID=UPI0039C3DA4E
MVHNSAGAMTSKGSGTIEVAALGRPFSLGMLYDCRNDSLIPGITLWDCDDLKTDIGERQQKYNHFDIVASESIEDKSSALKVEASLKASFLSGLVEVGGSANYLSDTKTSKNQARVTLMYYATTKFHELSMNQLGRGNVKHPYVFDQGIATHVVTGILYGAQAFFVFDREVSVNENHRDIQGNLKVMIKNIPCLSIEGEGSLKIEDNERKNVEKFSCRFIGDFFVKKPPTSFQEAVEVYQSLPTLLGANGENAVPVKVWLLPLTCLDSSAAKLVRQISIGLVQKSQSILEVFNDLDMRFNDAQKTQTAQQFPQIGEKLKTFKQMCSEFKLEFQQTLAKKLPSIRGGGEEEAVLAEILRKTCSSPFNSKDLNEWMDCKEREIYTVMSLTDMMTNTKIVSSQTDLYKESFKAEQAVCFVFTSLGSDEPYLSTSSNYLQQTPKPDDTQDPHPPDQWYNSRKEGEAMRQKAKLFSDFAEANKENKNITFLTVGLTNETQKGSSIYLYTDGFLVNENFEPPSKPATVTGSDINHSSVTLNISPPRFGAENITSYSVEYCVRGEDGWKQETASRAEEVTVSGLSPNTEYRFRCRAETPVGAGPANEVSGSIQTLPCSPPGRLHVESTSREISVSWEKPAELGQDVQVLSYIVEYAKPDQQVKEEDLHWEQMKAGAEKVVISGLQPETEYAVRVRCDCGTAGRSKESIAVKVSTAKPAHLTEFLKENSSGDPSSCSCHQDEA